jgi:urate oxidase
MKLISNRYGKARIRVLKVFRDGGRHDIREVEVSVMLEGNFDAVYLHGDNSLVVATDTMKNTVYALAKEKLQQQIEDFGLELGSHFLKRYPQVSRAIVRLVEQPWTRMSIDGQPHPHGFTAGGRARSFAEITSGREGASVESGVEEICILKTAGSGFAGYVRDEYTTLAETKDRIMATNMTGSWHFTAAPRSYSECNRRALEAMLKSFATEHSPSVQASLHQMSKAALQAVPEIDRVRVRMPNKHCLLVNLAPFDLENANEIFVPTDEPHGEIEAVVVR